jgi:hypothetical protein
MVASRWPRDFWSGVVTGSVKAPTTVDFAESELARRGLIVLSEQPSHGVASLQRGKPQQSLRLGSIKQLVDMLRLGVRSEIEDSRRLLHFVEDWDGDNSPGYRQETWELAVDFVLRFLADLDERFSIAHDAIELMPGSYGNIDVEIVFGARRIFFSFPADQTAAIRFFARDDESRDEIKGSLSTSTRVDWLIGWLAE